MVIFDQILLKSYIIFRRIFTKTDFSVPKKCLLVFCLRVVFYISGLGRSFHTINMGSIGQSASKLLAVKVQVQVRFARLWVNPGSNHFKSLTAKNFAALWSTESIYTLLKDLNLSQSVSEVQEAGSIQRVGFALSKWHYLI